MHVFNMMLSRDLGGIQQVFLDYNQVFRNHGVTVTPVTSKGAAIHGTEPGGIHLPNWGPGCVLSSLILRYYTQTQHPDVVIAHGGRAMTFATRFKAPRSKVVGVAHNPWGWRRVKKMDFLITVTQDLKDHFSAKGYPKDRIFVVPNMLRTTRPYQPFHIPKNRPWVVGSYGRFAKEKGFCYLIDAMACLRNGGRDVKLILGGSGELEGDLKRQVRDLNLQNRVIFPGWVKDREAFFNAIDIFCLPSVEEPFGLVVLEAMAHSTPMVATRVSGPKEILQNGKDALLCEAGSGQVLADRILDLIQNPDRVPPLTQAAHHKVTQAYGEEAMGKRLMEVFR